MEAAARREVPEQGEKPHGVALSSPGPLAIIKKLRFLLPVSWFFYSAGTRTSRNAESSCLHLAFSSW